MGFFFGMRYITHARASSTTAVTLFALPKAEYAQLVKLYPDQEEQITKNILASWDVQRSPHGEVKRVLEVAKRKKRSERIVRLVDAAARGDTDEVRQPDFWSCTELKFRGFYASVHKYLLFMFIIFAYRAEDSKTAASAAVAKEL